MALKPLEFQSFFGFRHLSFLWVLKNNFRMAFMKDTFWMKTQAITQPLNFPAGDFQKILRFIRPPEALAIQTLHQNPEAGAIPLQHFNQGLSFIAEGKQTTRIGIQLKTQFDDRG